MAVFDVKRAALLEALIKGAALVADEEADIAVILDQLDKVHDLTVNPLRAPYDAPLPVVIGNSPLDHVIHHMTFLKDEFVQKMAFHRASVLRDALAYLKRMAPEKKKSRKKTKSR